MSAVAAILELIDIGTYSNMWFWIALAAIWISVCHRVMGIPQDMIYATTEEGSPEERDFLDLVRIRCRRILRFSETGLIWRVGLWSFLLTALALLGFLYGRQLAQALFLIGLPLAMIRLMSRATARRLQNSGLSAEEMRLRLRRLRVAVQALAIIAVLVTAFWGMYVNISYGFPGR